MNILIISPHLDDETLGCGGTILKYSKKNNIDLLLATKPSNRDHHKKNKKLIESIKVDYNLKNVISLDLETMSLTFSNLNFLIDKIRYLNKKNKYDIVFTPYLYDVHTDHQIITHSVIIALKNFRKENKSKIYFYETLSETNFSTNPFKPNTYIDISKEFKKKIQILRKFKSEIGSHPFPRSVKSVEALAILRGSESNTRYAESFYLYNDNSDIL